MAWGLRTGFCVHHSAASQTQTPRSIQDYHMDTSAIASGGAADIGYNFLIDREGRIFEGRGWTVIGAHAANANTENIGVCVIGDYTGQLPSSVALNALAWLYREANRRRGATLTVRTHRNTGTTATSCPGNRLYDWTHASLASHVPGDMPTPPPAAIPPTRPAPGTPIDFPLPVGSYFGPKGGPNTSYSGYYRRSVRGRTDREWLQEWVRQLQRRGWNARKGGSYLSKYGNDGLYGTEYRVLIKAFQRDQGLIPDGLLGPATWNAAFRNPIS